MTTMFPLPAFDHVAAERVADATGAATTTVAEAMARGGEGGAVLRSGGVDVLDLMKQRVLAPDRLVDVRRIPGLDRIAATADGGLRVGATVTLERLAADPAVRRAWPALADAAAHSATPQLRHVSTVAGNLMQRPRCWYFRDEHFACRKKGGDRCFAHDGEHELHAVFDNARCAAVHASTSATALLAIGARVEIAGRGGRVRDLPFARVLVAPADDPTRENVVGPGELVTAVILPEPMPGTTSAHHKQGQRDSYDWALADVAVVLERDEAGVVRRARIALGAVAPVPRRATAAEAALAGQRVTPEAAARAGRAALEGATPLARNGYKLALVETLVARTVLRAAGAG